MRIFLCGHELGLGFVVGQRLLAEGHKVTMLTTSEDLLPNLAKNQMNPVLGHVEDASVQQQLAKADAVIDVELPNTLLLQKVHVARLRPYLLARVLQGSSRPLIVTSSAAVIGDTGPVPVDEGIRLRPLTGYAWLPRLEKEVLKSSGVRSIVIRPAWERHGCRPQSGAIAIGNWMKLARRFRRGKYIGSGENRYSAVHFDDLADLYCVALKRAGAGTILHGASENFSMKELAMTIHRSMGFKGEPSSLSLEQARGFSPIADALIRSHALSGDLARSLGWQPSRGSIMKEVEQSAFENVLVSRLGLPRTECKTV
jgi:nucleoside-diphosphate-sugar epimerase